MRPPLIWAALEPRPSWQRGLEAHLAPGGYRPGPRVPPAGATPRRFLRVVKNLWRWAIERGYCNANPWSKIAAVGRRSAGRLQLRIDEARRCEKVALKLARRYTHDRVGAKKIRIISTINSFHGRTLLTVTAGGQPKYASGFGPNPAGITHIPYNDVAALEREFAEGGDDICAVLLEPMQGEGGMRPGTPEYLQAARRLCTAHGALLILDEIQSGMGRTGALFSYMQKGVVPDILTSAKGCLLYTSPSPRDRTRSRMPSSAWKKKTT